MHRPETSRVAHPPGRDTPKIVDALQSLRRIALRKIKNYNRKRITSESARKLGLNVAEKNLLKTVRVPELFQEPFLRAQKYVAEYFQHETSDPTRGLRSVSGERYILVRAASISAEFIEVIKSMYPALEPEEARLTASNILFELAHAIGKADARSFHQKMGVVDPIEKLSAGPIHFAYSGWAYVDISPESKAVPNEDYYLIYDHPQSFEADAWLAENRKSEHPVCFMNAGYSSGWCEESFGLSLGTPAFLGECVAPTSANALPLRFQAARQGNGEHAA